MLSISECWWKCIFKDLGKFEIEDSKNMGVLEMCLDAKFLHKCPFHLDTEHFWNWEVSLT